MKKALLIAQWEFRSAVVRRAYIIAVVALPLLFGGVGVVSALTARSAATANAGGPTALVDKTGIVDVAFAAEQSARREEFRTVDTGPPPLPAQPSSLVPYADVDAAVCRRERSPPSTSSRPTISPRATSLRTAATRGSLHSPRPASAPIRSPTRFARA